MKYFQLLLGITCLVLIMVLFFQLLTGIYIQVPFFTQWVDIKIQLLTVISLAFMSGVFMTLGIKGFLSSNELDDDFNL